MLVITNLLALSEYSLHLDVSEYSLGRTNMVQRQSEYLLSWHVSKYSLRLVVSECLLLQHVSEYSLRGAFQNAIPRL